MSRLTKDRMHIVSVIAHSVVATEISNDVEGREGFAQYQIKSLAASDRAVVNYFHKEQQRIRAALAEMMKKGDDGSSS